MIYDYMLRNNKQLFLTRSGRIKHLRKNRSEKKLIPTPQPKEEDMTIREISHYLDCMDRGSKTAFCSYLVDAGMFKNVKEARNTIDLYRYRNANSSTFLKRQAISDAFRNWRYVYGGAVRRMRKEQVIEEYNKKLQAYWRTQCLTSC